MAFQKVSFAYDILSKPSSRRLYDLHGILPDDPYDINSKNSNDFDFNNGTGFTHPSNTARADETLSGVLLGVFCDFMEGDFQMLRTFLSEWTLLHMPFRSAGRNRLSLGSLFNPSFAFAALWIRAALMR